MSKIRQVQTRMSRNKQNRTRLKRNQGWSGLIKTKQDWIRLSRNEKSLTELSWVEKKRTRLNRNEKHWKENKIHPVFAWLISKWWLMMMTTLLPMHHFGGKIFLSNVIVPMRTGMRIGAKKTDTAEHKLRTCCCWSCQQHGHARLSSSFIETHWTRDWGY